MINFWMIMLVTFLGGLIGGATGYMIHALSQRLKKSWHHRSQNGWPHIHWRDDVANWIPKVHRHKWWSD